VIEWSAHVVLPTTIIVVVTRVVNPPEEVFVGLSEGYVIKPVEQYISEEGKVTVLALPFFTKK